jgi:hypothetical protein
VHDAAVGHETPYRNAKFVGEPVVGGGSDHTPWVSVSMRLRWLAPSK